VAHPLKDREGVLEVEGEPERESLELGLGELLPVGHAVAVRVAHWVAVGLTELLLLRVPEVVPETVPRRPGAAAPPEALGLVVPHALWEGEKLAEREGEPVDEALGLGERVPLPDAVEAGVGVRHCVLVGEGLMVEDVVKVAVGETLKEVVAEGETRGVRVGLMLAVRPYVENIESEGMALPVGGVGPADAERVSEVDAVPVVK
jgi:hypothetical protein